MIKVNSITVKRGKNLVLQDFNFSWEKDENIVMLGPNGSGKTTLALALSGIIEIEEGSIVIDSRDINDYSLKGLRKKIGIVFQDPECQFVTTTVNREISFGLCNVEENRDIIREKTEDIIRDFNLEEIRESNPDELSGGEKQLVAMASIFAMEPDYIIFDEVTSFLDRAVRERVYSLWEKADSNLMIVTQNFSEIDFGDRVILLEEGKISFNSTVAEIRENRLIPTARTRFLDLLEENKEMIENYSEIKEIIK